VFQYAFIIIQILFLRALKEPSSQNDPMRVSVTKTAEAGTNRRPHHPEQSKNARHPEHQISAVILSDKYRLSS
jgi:hypothetical protein